MQTVPFKGQKNSKMAPKLRDEAPKKLRKIVDDALSVPGQEIPGLSVSIINSNGDDLFSYVKGYKDFTKKAEIDKESIYLLASATKQVTATAALQLVERGELDLDDGEQIETLVPELKNLPIATLNDDGSITLRPKRNKITLRHLLTHTSGIGYSFFDETTHTYASWFSSNEFSIKGERDIQYPLLYEPGTQWHYGVGIDWAGVVIERCTGKKLGDYFQENIFKPLGIKDTSFVLSGDLRKNLLPISYRDPRSGKLGWMPRSEHPPRGPKREKFHSGGGGLVSKPTEYIKFLATILNDGTSPHTGKQILKPQTNKLIFENQVPQFPNIGREGLTAADERFTNPLPNIYPQQGDPPQGWGISLFLTLEKGETGRAPNTGFWAGIANFYFWVDKETGIAGIVAAQILPFADPAVLEVWRKIETEVYNNLVKDPDNLVVAKL